MFRVYDFKGMLTTEAAWLFIFALTYSQKIYCPTITVVAKEKEGFLLSKSPRGGCLHQGYAASVHGC